MIVLDLTSGFDVARVSRRPLRSTRRFATSTGRALQFRTNARSSLPAAVARNAGDAVVRLAVDVLAVSRARATNSRGFHWRRRRTARPWIARRARTRARTRGGRRRIVLPSRGQARARVRELHGARRDCTPSATAASTSRDARRRRQPRPSTGSHDYPLETYSVTLDVAPYVVVEQQLDRSTASTEPLPFIYYVLPENAEKAALQFQDVPDDAAQPTRDAFGPFPFPKSKFALVETSSGAWSTRPRSRTARATPRGARRTAARTATPAATSCFDYILVHESAHEWWGNGVSADALGRLLDPRGLRDVRRSRVPREHGRAARVARRNTWTRGSASVRRDCAPVPRRRRRLGRRRTTS